MANDLKIIASWDNFRGGELGGFSARFPPQEGMWSGLNVNVYQNGRIGPRSGTKRFDLSSNTLGAITGMIYPRDLSSALFFMQNGATSGTWVRRFRGDDETSQPIATLSGHISGTAASGSSWGWTIANQKIYATAVGAGTYAIGTTSISQLATTSAARCIAMYGDRLVIGGMAGQTNRIRYSAAASESSWPVNNFIDIGGDTSAIIIGLFPIGNTLLIVINDGSIWLLTGVPGVNDTLRQVVTYPSSQGPGLSTLYLSPQTLGPDLNREKVWMTRDGQRVPERYFAGRVDQVNHLVFGTSSSQIAIETYDAPHGQVVSLRGGDEMAIYTAPYQKDDPTMGSLLYYRNGAWSSHDLGIGSTTLTNIHMISDRAGNIYIGKHATGTVPAFYILQTNVEKPPRNIQFQSIGDLSTSSANAASFSTEEKWVEGIEEWEVEYLVVDFFTYNTLAAQNNTFKVTVDVFGVDQGDGQSTSSQFTFSETPSGSSSTGSRRRRRFPVLPVLYGQGCRVNFTDLCGVEIESVRLEGKRRGAPAV